MLEGSCHCGQVSWRYDSEPEQATACNCTVCRRYGVIWIYGLDEVNVHVSGETIEYVRADGDGPLGFHFCPTCGCIAYWRGRRLREDGQRRVGVNVRLCEPANAAQIPLEHLDALDTWQDIPRPAKCVGDMWF